jgi:P22_AR N-terminal domain
MAKQDKQLGVQQAFKPAEQASIPFYGHELVAVRLEDGRIAAILSWMCAGMGLDRVAQVQRIQRKVALRDELVPVLVDTGGGAQAMHALTLRGLPGWLYSIDETRVNEAAREGVIRFQKEATDVLADHFARQTALAIASPATLVPAEAIPEPMRPARDADALTWADYYEQMATWLRWKADLDQWRERTDQLLAEHERQLDSLQNRRESDEALLRMVPELLERLGPEKLTTEHQAAVQTLVNRLHELAGFAYGTIHTELRQSFHVASYKDMLETQWPEVYQWFQQRIAAAEKRRQKSQ